MIALALGFILPTLFIGFAMGGLSYTIMAVFIGSITLLFMILFIPSTREDKIIIDRYFDRKYERMTFFKGIVKALKTKSFLAFLIQYSLFLTATTILTAIIVYIINFIILDPNMMMVLMAIFIVGAIIAVPFWQKIFKKLNNTKKYYVLGNLILVIALFPATFFQGLVDLAIMMFIIGFAMSSVWTFGIPVILSNTQDDFVVSTGVNQKGLLLGAWGLLTVFTSFLDELVIGIVFSATGFVGGIETYVDLVVTVADVNLVLWGIRLLIGVIPATIILIGALVFWKFFPLTQDKILENKLKF
jgi:Na+/melibiose symporter-like transporter